MKTTFDLPDNLVQRTKVLAAQENTTMREIVSRALRAELERSEKNKDEPGWKKHAGAMEKYGQAEVINKAVEEAFGQIDEEMWK